MVLTDDIERLLGIWEESAPSSLTPATVPAVLLQNMSWAQSARYVNRCLVSRAHQNQKWLVVLKVCLTHHRLLRESRGQYAVHLTNPAVSPALAHPYGAGLAQPSQSFKSDMSGPPARAPGMDSTTGALPTAPFYMQNDASPPLGLRSFRDGTSKKAFDLSTFIRFYAAYLDMVLDVYSKVKYLPVNVPGTEPPKFKCALAAVFLGKHMSN
jgi:hypothetical protein